MSESIDYSDRCTGCGAHISEPHDPACLLDGGEAADDSADWSASADEGPLSRSS